mgnify:CR=1 FL=1
MGMTINPRGRGFEVYVRAAGPDGNSQKIRRTLPTYEEAERYGHSAMSSILAGRSIPKPKEVVKVKPKTLGEDSLQEGLAVCHAIHPDVPRRLSHRPQVALRDQGGGRADG